MKLAAPGSQDGAAGLEESIERQAHFETAWKSYLPGLRRLCLRWMNGRREDAEDAVGQVAITALQMIPRNLDPSAARSWLFRLAYTKCMDIHRERRRAPLPITGNEAPTPGFASGALPLETAILKAELYFIVRRSIRELSPRLRSVAELHVLRDMQYAEIAEVLAISAVNVRKRMQEVRAALSGPLRTYLEGSSDSFRPPPRTVEYCREQTAREEECPPTPSPSRTPQWSTEAIRKYVYKHPRGWKKRWELASRLREAGLLGEAALHYQEAVIRQPRQPALWIELGETLFSLGRAGAAVAAYEAGLRWARSEPTRHRLLELIACCRKNTG
jgi:RNA polymerase sigma factor (sigma-70 family)